MRAVAVMRVLAREAGGELNEVRLARACRAQSGESLRDGAIVFGQGTNVLDECRTSPRGYAREIEEVFEEIGYAAEWWRAGLRTGLGRTRVPGRCGDRPSTVQ